MNRINDHAGIAEAMPVAPLAGIIMLAVLLRMVFYTGYFGSDEVTYVESAFKMLDGDWSVSTYVGANRYGVNLPIALFGAIFGRHEWAAAAYSMVSSVAEVLLVAVMGRRLVGAKAALLAALVLACLPTHVHLAGRLMADNPVALCITASFLFFFDGELRQRPLSYFIAGCAAGLSFWVKPAAVFYLLVFLLYPLFFRRLDARWAWMVLGFTVAVLANMLLFRLLTGDLMFMFKAMTSRQTSGYLESEAAAGTVQSSPFYYLDYLFRAVHHTWLLGYAATLAVVSRMVTPGPMHFGDDAGRGWRSLLYWAVAMIAVMSLLVVSWRPLMFIPKQTNYMLMFTAALALVAGTGLARLSPRVMVAALAVLLLPSLVLASLQQSAIQAFTANSKAAVVFAKAHPGALVFGNASPQRAAQFEQLVRPDEAVPTIRPITELLGTGKRTAALAAGDVYVVVDETTLAWAGGEPIRRLQDVPACWEAIETLRPVGLGTGWKITNALATWMGRQSGVIGRVGNKLSAPLNPGKAVAFRLPSGCR